MQLVVLAWLWPDIHHRRSRGGPTAGDSAHTDCHILSTSFHLTLCKRGRIREREGGWGEDGESCSLRVILVCAMVGASGRVLRRKHLWRSNVFVNANVFPLLPFMSALITKNASRGRLLESLKFMKLSPISSVASRMRGIKYALASGTCREGGWY